MPPSSSMVVEARSRSPGPDQRAPFRDVRAATRSRTVATTFRIVAATAAVPVAVAVAATDLILRELAPPPLLLRPEISSRNPVCCLPCSRFSLTHYFLALARDSHGRIGLCTNYGYRGTISRARLGYAIGFAGPDENAHTRDTRIRRARSAFTRGNA